MNLILASTSPYRARLLERLRLPFIQMDPLYEELAIPGESSTTRCRRLATGKANALMAQGPRGPFLVIASDQVACLDNGEFLGKPGGFDAAFSQLKACAGSWVTFETAICLMSDQGMVQVDSEAMSVKFRQLSDTDITRYLNLETPWNAAGSIKVESLGITLIEDSRGRDLNTILGLPLMLLVDMLASLGINVLNEIK